MYLCCRAIHENTDIRVLLTGEISDELFERDYNTIAERINEYRKSMNKKPRRKRRKTKYNKVRA